MFTVAVAVRDENSLVVLVYLFSVVFGFPLRLLKNHVGCTVLSLIFCFIRLLSLTLPMGNQASNKFNVISRQLIMYITVHTIIVIVQL